MSTPSDTPPGSRRFSELANDGCGSTHLGPLKAAVLEHGAHLGIAHDGDADRCLAVDHEGGYFSIVDRVKELIKY